MASTIQKCTQKSNFCKTLTQKTAKSGNNAGQKKIFKKNTQNKKAITTKPNKKQLNRQVSKNFSSEVVNFARNEAAAKTVAVGEEYKIQYGDNLSTLAKIWDCTEEDILKDNPQIDPTSKKIYAGKTIKRPNTGANNVKTEEIQEAAGTVIKTTEVTDDGTRITLVNEEGTSLVAEFDENGHLIKCGDADLNKIERFSNLGYYAGQIYRNVTAQDLKTQITGVSQNNKTIPMVMAAIRHTDGNDIQKLLDDYYNTKNPEFSIGQVLLDSVSDFFSSVPGAKLCLSTILRRNCGENKENSSKDSTNSNRTNKDLKSTAKTSLKNIFSNIFNGNKNRTNTNLYYDLSNEWGIKEKDINNIKNLAFSKFLRSRTPDNITFYDIKVAQDITK